MLNPSAHLLTDRYRRWPVLRPADRVHPVFDGAGPAIIGLSWLGACRGSFRFSAVKRPFADNRFDCIAKKFAVRVVVMVSAPSLAVALNQAFRGRDTMQSFDTEQPSLRRAAFDDQNLLSGQFWAELRVFLVVAKAKSFNRAAEFLNTSQPTVSRQVKRLQDLMGSQLFVPSQHGVKLTPRGEDLANALTKLDRSLFALTNDLKGDTKQAEGIVRVSVAEGLNVFFLAPALRQFATDYPKIQMHLKDPQAIMSLHDNRTDLMIGFQPVESTEVVCRKLGYLHFIPVASPSYISDHGLPRRQNLEQHFFLQSEHYMARTGAWAQWNYILSRGRVAHICDNSVAYGMLVKAGLGIGLMGSYAVMEPSAVPLEIDVKISLPMYAIVLEERLKAKPVRVAFDWLCGLFGPDNPWFAPEFRLDIPPSPYDAGFKALLNIDQRPAV